MLTNTQKELLNLKAELSRVGFFDFAKKKLIKTKISQLKRERENLIFYKKSNKMIGIY